MRSKVTFDEDAKAKENRDLTANMEEAAKDSKDRGAKEKPLDPTPRKDKQIQTSKEKLQQWAERIGLK